MSSLFKRVVAGRQLGAMIGGGAIVALVVAGGTAAGLSIASGGSTTVSPPTTTSTSAAAPMAMARSRPQVKAVRAAWTAAGVGAGDGDCLGEALAGGAALPPVPISAGWHARYDADPEHRWLRSQLQDIASELAGTAVSSARVQSR